jgi:hypothetical protein
VASLSYAPMRWRERVAYPHFGHSISTSTPCVPPVLARWMFSVLSASWCKNPIFQLPVQLRRQELNGRKMAATGISAQMHRRQGGRGRNRGAQASTCTSPGEGRLIDRPAGAVAFPSTPDRLLFSRNVRCGVRCCDATTDGDRWLASPPSQLSGRSAAPTPIADIEDQGYKGKATQIKEKEAHCLCLIQHIGCPLCLAVAVAVATALPRPPPPP